MLDIVLHTLVEFPERRVELFGSLLEPFLGHEGVGGILLACGGIFRPFGLGEVGEGRAQDIGPQCEGEAFFEGVGRLEVGGEEHEAEVGFGSGDGEGEELGVRGGPDLLDEFRELDFGLASVLAGEQGPLAVIDVVKQVHDVPAFGGHQGGGGF